MESIINSYLDDHVDDKILLGYTLRDLQELNDSLKVLINITEEPLLYYKTTNNITIGYNPEININNIINDKDDDSEEDDTSSNTTQQSTDTENEIDYAYDGH